MIDTGKYVVITNQNWRQYAATAQGGAFPNDELAPVLQGRCGYKGWQQPGLPHDFKGPRPVDTVIPRSQWANMIRGGAGLKAFEAIQSQGIHSKDQDGLNFCWGYGSTRVMELRRVLEGLPHIELAPESVCVPCTGGKNVGGYASEAFDQMNSGGVCEARFLPADHSDRITDWRGNVIRVDSSKWTAGWQDNAATHKTIDWYNIDGSGSAGMFDSVMTCLLNDYPCACGLGYWGHLVAFVAPVLFSDGSFGVLMQNSWLDGDWPRKGDNGLAILTEGRATPDGAAAAILTSDVPVGPPDPGPCPLPNPNL